MCANSKGGSEWPPWLIQPKNDQVDSEIKDMGQSYMFRKKFINQPKLLEGE